MNEYIEQIENIAAKCSVSQSDGYSHIMRICEAMNEEQQMNVDVALIMKKDITDIVNRQLIAGKNNYKEIYDTFYEIVKVVQNNY